MQPGENGERGQKKSMAQFQLKWVHPWLVLQPQFALRSCCIDDHSYTIKSCMRKRTNDHFCLSTCRPHSSIPKAEGPVMVSFVLVSHTQSACNITQVHSAANDAVPASHLP